MSIKHKVFTGLAIALLLILAPSALVQAQEVDVDLIWEAESYTPVLYDGKSRYTPGASVTLQAVPYRVGTGETIDPAVTEFTWKVNGRQMRQGVGEDAFVFNGSTQKEHTISVTLRNSNKISQSVTLKPSAPEVVLYPESPLYGTQSAFALMGTFHMRDQEATIRAVPYYFTVASAVDLGLLYRWSVNGEDIDQDLTGDDASALTMRAPEGNGSAHLGLEVEKQNSLYHLVRDQLNVRYGL
ncbi:MAG: hypothetical protein WDZ82_03350 [Candidatus Paceibacterota bacterium]